MAPDYKKHDPRGWCGDPRRGAALGRHSYMPSDYEGKLYLRRVPLNAGGYDRNGTYFGCGEPLFWVASTGCELDYMLRARTREDAKRKVREQYPDARFCR